MYFGKCTLCIISFLYFAYFLWKTGPAINRDLKPGRGKTRLGEATLKNELYSLSPPWHEKHPKYSHVALTDRRSAPVHPGDQVNTCATCSFTHVFAIRTKRWSLFSLSDHTALTQVICSTPTNSSHLLLGLNNVWLDLQLRSVYFQALSTTSTIYFGASESLAWADCERGLQERVSLLSHSGSGQTIPVAIEIVCSCCFILLQLNLTLCDCLVFVNGGKWKEALWLYSLSSVAVAPSAG